MGPGQTRDTVMELRAARGTKSISEIMALLEENSKKTGAPVPCESSVRSVLTGDLDKISGFNQDSTLKPLHDVLIKSAGSEALLEIIRMQEETIQRLAAQLAALEDSQKARCKKCEQDIAKLWGQIAIKDRRMERKDRWIAELLKLPGENDEQEENAN